MIDLQRILKEIEDNLPTYTNAICLQGVKDFLDPFYATGLLSAVKKDPSHIPRNFNVSIFPNMTYTNSILSELKMYRTRILKLNPKTCYSYHVDREQRIHIPIVTNENNFFIIDDEVKRLPADGNHYLLDTTKPHTFVNASFDDRIHIVGCVYN
jgi:hypothetical protein